MNNVKYQSVFETRFTTTLLYKGILNISNKSIFKFKFKKKIITKIFLDCVMSVE